MSKHIDRNDGTQNMSTEQQMKSYLIQIQNIKNLSLS